MSAVALVDHYWSMGGVKRALIALEYVAKGMGD